MPGKKGFGDSRQKSSGTPMYKMNGFSGFGNSPLRNEWEYGPYSYDHNTKKATDSHYGDPHGPKPTSKKKTTKTGAHEGHMAVKQSKRTRSKLGVVKTAKLKKED